MVNPTWANIFNTLIVGCFIFLILGPISAHAGGAFKVIAVEAKVSAKLPDGKVLPQIKLNEMLPTGTKVNSDQTGQAVLQYGDGFNLFSVQNNSSLELKM